MYSTVYMYCTYCTLYVPANLSYTFRSSCTVCTQGITMLHRPSLDSSEESAFMKQGYSIFFDEMISDENTKHQLKNIAIVMKQLIESLLVTEHLPLKHKTSIGKHCHYNATFNISIESLLVTVHLPLLLQNFGTVC